MELNSEDHLLLTVQAEHCELAPFCGQFSTAKRTLNTTQVVQTGWMQHAEEAKPARGLGGNARGFSARSRSLKTARWGENIHVIKIIGVQIGAQFRGWGGGGGGKKTDKEPSKRLEML